MGWCFAKPGAREKAGFIKRFDARFWTVDFPRPMMAGVTTTTSDGLRIDAVFYKANDLAGLIWEAEDRWDHPLCAYETNRDFRGCTLSFHWRSSGIMPLDAINGPTLTIQGRDRSGAAKSWYVRLRNYARGTDEDASITLDFDAMEGGFLLPEEADPVWAGDVDRLFISLVPPSYIDADMPLPAPAEAWVTLDAIRCDGRSSVLAIADALVPAHGMRIATGYDDAYNQSPARLIRNIRNLGYRGLVNHYVGMSHYLRLAYDGGSGLYLVSLAGGTLNVAAAAWHADWAVRLKAAGYGLILSMSYELLDQHCYGDWKQRAEDGRSAATGWSPPSTLLSPAHSGAMNYLRSVAQAFTAIAVAAGQPVQFQIGEPWWWQVPRTGQLCLYDDTARAALGPALVSIPDVRAPLSAAQLAALDLAGALLATSTAAIATAVRAVAADAKLLLLVYMPTVLAPAAPELRRANVPVGWAAPAFDVLQLEDYDWVTAGNLGATQRGVAAMNARLNYPVAQQHYFSGFVLAAADAAEWGAIAKAADAARARGSAETFYWALPQVIRDGFVQFDGGESPVLAFDDVSFPLAVSAAATVTPAFSTAIVTTGAGQEQRNADWSDARLSYDVGPGVRSQADLVQLIAFFRARRGPARGFRFRDPLDSSSAGMADPPGAADQPIAVGDGFTTRFPVTKSYGGDDPQVRRVTRPVAGTVRVSLGGVEVTSGWALADGGVVAFDVAPPAGQAIAAGYLFDVPVRFAQDELEVGLTTFLAGEAPSVPLIEIREDAS